MPISAFALFEPPERLLSNSWFSTMLIPGTLLLFAAIFYFGGRYNDQRTGNQTFTRWIGAGLTAIAFWFGLERFMWTRDLMYGELLRRAGDKFLWAHYLSLILPLIAVIIIVVLQWWDKKQQEYIA